MIELTQQQRELLDAGEVVEVPDSGTVHALVILSRETYHRLRNSVEGSVDWTREEMRQLLARAATESWDGPGLDAYERYDEERRK